MSTSSYFNFKIHSSQEQFLNELEINPTKVTSQGREFRIITLNGTSFDDVKNQTLAKIKTVIEANNRTIASNRKSIDSMSGLSKFFARISGKLTTLENNLSNLSYTNEKIKYLYSNINQSQAPNNDYRFTKSLNAENTSEFAAANTDTNSYSSQNLKAENTEKFVETEELTEQQKADKAAQERLENGY